MDAAKVLFAEQGYEGTTIGDIVAKSGVSVGSIYHQFGGKAEVCLALIERDLSSLAAASWQAVKELQATGETDSVELYLAGASAYLLETWRDRQILRITLAADSPREVAEKRGSSEARFLRAATKSMVIGEPPLPDSSALVVTSLLRAAAVQLIDIDNESLAVRVAEYYTGLIRTLAHS